MLNKDFYGLDSAAEVVGAPQRYLTFVHDDDFAYQVDSYYLGKFGDDWYVIEAHGCSCWGGEYQFTAGPFKSIDALRKEWLADYEASGNHYNNFLEHWRLALDNAEASGVGW